MRGEQTLQRVALALGLTLCFCSQAGGRELPDPFGPTTLQARSLRGLSGEVAALVLRAEPGGELPMEVLALPLPTSPEAETLERRVAVFVEVDGGSLLELNRARLARLEVYLYALGAEDHAVADYRAEVTVVDIQERGEVIWQSGVKYYGELSLPPGEYRLRVLVRNYQSRAAGLQEVAVAVPPAAAGELSPPLVPDLSGGRPWVAVRAWRDHLLRLENEPAAEEVLRSAYPFSIGTQAISPAALPVLVAGRSQTLYLSQPIGAGEDLTLELIRPIDPPNAEPKVLATLSPTITDRGEVLGRDIVEMQVKWPEGVAPGPAALRVRNPAGDASASIEVRLVAADTRDQSLLWSDLKWREDSALASAAAGARGLDNAAPPSDRGTTGRKARKLTAAYLEVLKTLDDLSSPASIRRLVDFETEVMNQGKRKAAGRLSAAELEAARQLAAGDPETLVPLIQLHQDLYLAYRGRRMFSLATHSRVLVERLAELYVETGSGQGPKVIASRALTSLGGYLQTAGLTMGSQRLYHRSLALNPGAKETLLALGITYQQFGAYAEARDALSNLVDQFPDFAEGRLRLALTEQRLGRRSAARLHLQKAIDTPAPPWVRALVFEETARMQLQLGKTQEAWDLLQQVDDPGAGTLSMMAYLSDRLGSPNRSLELIRGIQAGADAPSPRKIYDGHPENALTELRRQLKDAAEQRRDRLSAANAGSDSQETRR